MTTAKKPADWTKFAATMRRVCDGGLHAQLHPIAGFEYFIGQARTTPATVERLILAGLIEAPAVTFGTKSFTYVVTPLGQKTAAPPKKES